MTQHEQDQEHEGWTKNPLATLAGSTSSDRDASRSPGIGWSQQTVGLAHPDGITRVTGWVHPAAPGLAVTPTLGGPGFRVTHIVSGGALGTTFSRTTEQAGKIACALAAVVDFRLDVRTLALPDNIARLRETERAASEAVGVPRYPCEVLGPVSRAEEWHTQAANMDAAWAKSGAARAADVDPASGTRADSWSTPNKAKP